MTDEIEQWRNGAIPQTDAEKIDWLCWWLEGLPNKELGDIAPIVRRLRSQLEGAVGEKERFKEQGVRATRLWQDECAVTAALRSDLEIAENERHAASVSFANAQDEIKRLEAKRCICERWAGFSSHCPVHGEFEDRDQNGRQLTTTMKTLEEAQAEIARLKELYSEQVQRADKYFIDSQRLRAALLKIVGFSEPGFMHAALEIARAALANIRETPHNTNSTPDDTESLDNGC